MLNNVSPVVEINLMNTFKCQKLELQMVRPVLYWNCRIECKEHQSCNPVKLDGSDMVVEVDETYFGGKKYNWGRVHKVWWIFGGVEILWKVFCLTSCR